MTDPVLELEASDGPERVLDGDLHSVTDDEYFDALATMPPLLDEHGQVVDHLDGVVDERPGR
jgi:hypothetical protein